MEIRSFGAGRRMRECERLIREMCASYSGMIILLPIPTTRDNIYISGTEKSISSLYPLFNSNTLLVGYNLPDFLVEKALLSGSRVFDAAKDEIFLAENAKISANGAMGYLLTNNSRDMADLRIGVVGYGRIGKEMVRLLLLFGADVTVYTGRKSVAVELGESCVGAVVLSEQSDFSRLDILINTAPARQIDESRLPDNLEIIDLASGNIFDSSDRLIKLASIPDVMYPHTAGRLYAEAIIRFLQEVWL